MLSNKLNDKIQYNGIAILLCFLFMIISIFINSSAKASITGFGRDIFNTTHLFSISYSIFLISSTLYYSIHSLIEKNGKLFFIGISLALMSSYLMLVLVVVSGKLNPYIGITTGLFFRSFGG